ncbi:MAG: NADH-quinone oxidoreductase subunit L [Devosia sp.]
MVEILVFLPLIGFLVAFLFGRQIGPMASMVATTGLVFVAAALSWAVFITWGFGDAATERVLLAEWIVSGDLEIAWRLRVDTLTAVMLVVVNTVSALVHLYSFGYMSHDKSKAKFFAYLSLFTFAMLMLVTADNLVQMFFGWEGVGLASYLLIGFWSDRASANAAAIKAFVVNRVGDFGFLLGIFTLFALTGSVGLDAIFAAGPQAAQLTFSFLGFEVPAIELACLLLFIGAMGKSAQFLLHTWLPDAMEGPTPVSALIHAATMVTAGVFMVARMSPVFEFAPVALAVVTFIGATTAMFAATIGCAQNDIKRVIAYSTCSQLGYMFAALGVGAYSIAIFHLFTHAFFKALLFLSAGSVIHAMHDEQDMRRMGGLWRKIPWTYGAMLVGTLALTGFPLTAGYYSKDAIVEATFVGQNAFAMYAFVLLVAAAALTAFYSWRAVFMTFHGPTRAPADTFKHAHESPPSMLIPLMVLSIGALVAGAVFYPQFAGKAYEAFWNGALYTGADNHVLHDFHGVPEWVVLSPAIAMAVGLVVAVLMYLVFPSSPKAAVAAMPRLHKFFLNKWYFDELYDFIFVRPVKALGRLFWAGDGKVIDGVGPDGIAARVRNLAGLASRLQSGYLYHYAFVMLTGIAVFVTIMIMLQRGLL